MSKSLRWLIIANIVVGLFTLFNLVIYPRYIYTAPEPIRSANPLINCSHTKYRVTRSRSGPPHPAATPSWAYDVISCREAFLFGNKILRMAGIVQMLHTRTTPSDKYLPNAHRTRTLTSRARDQARRTATVSLTVPGPCHTVLAMCHRKEHHGLLTCSIWLIQSVLLTLSVPSITAYQSHNSSILQTVITAWLDARIQ